MFFLSVNRIYINLTYLQAQFGKLPINQFLDLLINYRSLQKNIFYEYP